MSLLNFMEQKAEEKGMAVCSNCGAPDIFFSLLGKCADCDRFVEEKPKIKKFQFAIEVLVEFTEKYDEFMPLDIKKVFLQIGKAIVHKIKTTNTVDNSKLIQFQYQCNHIPQLGSNEFGGAIDGKNMAIQMVECECAEDKMTIAKSLAAAVVSLQFIRNYKVPNEFILETAFSQSKPIQKDVKSPFSATQKSSGCLGILLTLTFMIFTIISILML